MKKCKSLLSLFLAVMLVASTIVIPTSAVEVPELVVKPSVDTVDKGEGTAKVVYTISVNPNGTGIAAMQFTLDAPEGMVLATNKLPNGVANQGKSGYWINAKGLKYTEDEDTGDITGVFTTFAYEPNSAYFGASGGTTQYILTGNDEVVVMTIEATIKIDEAKVYTLGVTGFTCGGVGSVNLNAAEPSVGTVTVVAPTVKVTGVSLNKTATTLTLENNETEPLVATVNPADATNKNVTWKSSNPAVATVDENGEVTAVSKGTATITVTTEDGGMTATCVVTVEKPSVGGKVKITGDAIVGETLTAEFYDGVPPFGTWTYSWNGVEGEQTYVVKAADVGKEIELVVVNSACEGSLTAKSAVVEKKAGPAAPAAPTKKEVTSDTIKVNVVAGQEYSIDGGANWNTTGVFTGLAANKEYSIVTRVAETAEAKTSAASAALNVTTNKLEQILSGADSVTVVFGGTKDLGVTSNAADAELKYTVEGALPAGTTFDKGTIKAGTVAGEFKVKVNADAKGDYYAATEKVVTVKITAKEVKDLAVTMEGWTFGDTAKTPVFTAPAGSGEPVITYNKTIGDAGDYTVTVECETSEFIYRGTANFTIARKNISGAEITLGDALTYTGSEQTQTVAGVKLNGKDLTAADYDVTDNNVTTAGEHTLTVTGKGNYTGTAQKTFAVAKANQAELTVKTDKAAIKYDETATLSVVGGNTAGEVTYTLVEGPATIANGVVTPTGVGTIKVKAVMAGNDNYNAVESANVVEIVVSKADQAVPAKPTGSYAVSTTDATEFVYTVTAVAGAEYSMDGTTWQDSNVFDGIAPGATVTFSVRMKADDNHNASPATAGDAVEFVKLANTNVPALKYTVTGIVGSRTITITPVDGAEYKFGTGEWGATNTFDDNSTSGATVAIAIRYKETATLKASEAATASVNTAKTAQTVTAPAVTFEYGNTGKIVPTASSKSFTYEVTAGADVISVDANGVVTALKAGSAQVTVTALEDETYAQATVVVNVTVNKVKVTVKADDVQLKINGELPASYTYTVTGLKGTDALTATVAVKDGATPDVSKAGEYVLVASGATFTAGSADNYEITYVDGTLSIKNNIVVIPVAPKPDEDEPVEPEKPVVPVIGGVFTDVKADDWFAGAVEYVYENGLMDGMGNNQFAPYGTTTRGQIVTILWRLEGKPLPSITNPFSDVGYSEWYSTAITWAAEHKIVNGVTTTTFDPTAPITREQIAAILYRYAQYKGYDMTAAADLGTYADAASVSGYAVNAMKWACGTGLINGIDGALAPSGTAIRCQAATLLMRFCENVAK